MKVEENNKKELKEGGWRWLNLWTWGTWSLGKMRNFQLKIPEGKKFLLLQDWQFKSETSSSTITKCTCISDPSPNHLGLRLRLMLSNCYSPLLAPGALKSFPILRWNFIEQGGKRLKKKKILIIFLKHYWYFVSQEKTFIYLVPENLDRRFLLK